MEKHNQHFIGEGYLKAWRDRSTPDGAYVWTADKRGKELKRQSPSKLFSAYEFYTAFDQANRVLELENKLSELETNFGMLLKNLEKRKPLEVEDRKTVALFAATLYSRTDLQKREQSEFWGLLIDAVNKLPKHETDKVRQMDAYKAAENLQQQPMPFYMFVFVNLATPYLLRKNCAILETEDDVGFITSDNPCLWMDGEGMPVGIPTPNFALESDELEVIFPVSPKQCISLKTRGPDGFCPIDAKPKIIEGINMMTVGNADKLIVINSKVVKPEWFATKSIS